MVDTHTISGRIMYANGRVASNVEVRVVDQDTPGQSNDITITPGLSDAHGLFTVTYDPVDFLDFAALPFFGLHHPTSGAAGGAAGSQGHHDLLNISTPLLRFCCPIDGKDSIYTTPIVLFQDHYQLPESLPNQFLPSKNGFKFVNNFSGLPIKLPFTIPGLPDLNKLATGYGLCGGMSAAAADFYMANVDIPTRETAPTSNSNLFNYIFRRSMDSFKMGETVARFAIWMSLPVDGPNGVMSLTLPEVDKLRAVIASRHLVPIGLVAAKVTNKLEIPANLSKNHQVLAYAYTDNADGTTDIYVYDPNTRYDQGSDAVLIRVKKLEVGLGPQGIVSGIQCVSHNVGIFDNTGTREPVRGFFLMPYEPNVPPAGLK